jgi:hypothetical protein
MRGRIGIPIVLLGWVKVNPEWISSRIPLLQVLLKAQPR